MLYYVSYSRELFLLVFRCLRKFRSASWPVSSALLILVRFSCSSQWMIWAFVCLWTLSLLWVRYHNFTQLLCCNLYVQPVCRLLTNTCLLSLSLSINFPISSLMTNPSLLWLIIPSVLWSVPCFLYVTFAFSQLVSLLCWRWKQFVSSDVTNHVPGYTVLHRESPTAACCVWEVLCSCYVQVHTIQFSFSNTERSLSIISEGAVMSKR